MKIKELDQHCGECGIIEYCGNGFGFCICTDTRFGDMEESDYKRIAETAADIKSLDICDGCKRQDCGPYASPTDPADEDCEHADEARDYYCGQIAAFVEKMK